MAIALMLIGTILTAVGDIYAKKWSLNGPTTYWVAAFLIYAASSALFITALRGEKLTMVNAIWSVAIFCTSTFIGLFIFRERLSSVQFVALFFAFLSIVLFSFDGSS